jgi:hypothetical protein
VEDRTADPSHDDTAEAIGQPIIASSVPARPSATGRRAHDVLVALAAPVAVAA